MTISPDIVEKIKNSTIKPWKVIMHNDDVTKFSFVVEVLKRIFGHNETSATLSALLVHQTGQAVVGAYSREVAELKIQQVDSLAKERKFPLKCTIEAY